MPEPPEEDLPPLGQPTPVRRPPGSEPRLRRSHVVPVLALVLGLLAGFVAGQAFEGEADEQARPEGGDVDEAPAPATTTGPTTTTLAPLPPVCLQTIRSAQQALVLLEQGMQSFGELDLAELESVLADIERLRDGFARRTQECLEHPRVGTDG